MVFVGFTTSLCSANCANFTITLETACAKHNCWINTFVRCTVPITLQQSNTASLLCTFEALALIATAAATGVESSVTIVNAYTIIKLVESIFITGITAVAI